MKIKAGYAKVLAKVNQLSDSSDFKKKISLVDEHINTFALQGADRQEALMLKAYIFMDHEHNEEAVKLFDEILKIDPQSDKSSEAAIMKAELTTSA